MQAGQPEGLVELLGIIFDIVEIVAFEPGLADEPVQKLQCFLGRASQYFIIDDDQFFAMLAIEGFLEGGPTVAHQPVMVRQGLDPAVNRRAFLGRGPQPGVFIGVLAKQALDTVHDPGYVAHAGNDLRTGRQPVQKRHFGAPDAVGVEKHLAVGGGGAEGVHEGPQDRRALCLLQKQGHFAA